MKRLALATVCMALLANSGCCLFGQPWWGGYGYGTGYGPAYGGSYQGYPAGGCPNGACGTLPGAYNGAVPTAVGPYGYPQTAIVDPMPAY